MTPKEILQADSDEFLKFQNVRNPMTSRPDLHAFLLLDKICPNDGRDVLGGAGHEEVWLSFDPEVAFGKMTTEQAMDLKRCGVMYDEDHDSFSMFV